VPRSTRTRIEPEARRTQILQATHAVTLERGVHDLRIADVADALSISTGLVHYHFATKDELIEAMLRETAAAEIAGIRRSLARATGPKRRLTRLIEVYLPSGKRDPSWVLWIDAWGEALRDDNVRRISEELDQAWVDLLAEVIAEGVAAGVFDAVDPVATAWRLCALLDGLGMQVVLHHTTMTRAQMRRHARKAATLELGLDLPTR
jgi:AcrR family transcriptional regulator